MKELAVVLDIGVVTVVPVFAGEVRVDLVSQEGVGTRREVVLGRSKGDGDNYKLKSGELMIFKLRG